MRRKGDSSVNGENAATTAFEELSICSAADMKSEELFYSQGEEQDRKNGCVGHLRGDFGSGTEFWTTWWPHQNDRLNKEPFKSDLDRVVNWLRQDAYPLKDLQTMQ